MAALLPGNDAFDLSFNWYGNLFRSDVLADLFRQGPSNYDFQAGYSHELWEGGPDLRLNATGYRFSARSGAYGGRAGVEFKARDGMLSVKYEASHDRVHGTYHTVGGFVNVGFELANLLDGESPFVMPEPIFSSPRNLRRLLTKPVKRDYFSRARTATSSCPNSCSGDLAGITLTGEGCGCEAEEVSTISNCYAFSASGGTTLPDWIYISRTNSAGDLRIRVYTDNACTAQLSTVVLIAGLSCVQAQAFLDPSSIKAFTYEPSPLSSSAGAGCISLYSSD